MCISELKDQNEIALVIARKPLSYITLTLTVYTTKGKCKAQQLIHYVTLIVTIL
jgi:hypothetical protein